MKPHDTIIAADIGNSRLKTLHGNETTTFGYAADWQAGLRAKLESLYTEGISIAGYSSVNPSVFRVFGDIAELLNITLVDAAMYAPVLGLISFVGISGMGSDRMLGLYGARRYCAPPFITVDCGTAITVNAVDANGNCIGGVILPGLETQMKSLTLYTANLWEIPLFFEEFSSGTSTEQAIRRGIVHGATGGIIHLINSISQQLGVSHIPVFLTGGGGGIVGEGLVPFADVISKPALVCEGVRFVVEKIAETGGITKNGG